MSKCLKLKKWVSFSTLVDVDDYINIEVDAKDFDDESLLKEVEERGYFVAFAEGMERSDILMLYNILLEREDLKNWEELRLRDKLLEMING